MGLEAARLRPFHLFPDRRNGMRVHALRRQLAFGNQFLDGIDIDRAIDLAEKLGFLLGPIAVADRIDEKVTQRLTLEQFAQHVIDLAAQRSTRLFKLFQKPAIDFAFPRVRGA
jgi:hypothetical protein